jgi:transcriptional regulator with XRE-family HTH domain
MKAASLYSDADNRYDWTPLKHHELVEFIETRRLTTGLTKEKLSTEAGYSNSLFSNLSNRLQRFSQESFTALAKTVISKMAQLQIDLDKQLPEKIEAPTKIEKPIYGVMSIEQMITKIKAAGYKVMRRTEGWEEI